VDLCLLSPKEKIIAMSPMASGYFQTVSEEATPGTRYVYRLHDRDSQAVLDRPDPASRRQPEGVHGPSEVVSSRFDWEDKDWAGVPLSRMILYELHVGTFTASGTLEAVIEHLQRFNDLGITAIELMPVAQFPGVRNWGYDGVFPFAVQQSYGGLIGLKRLVNACHLSGIAVILDVVYNHLGPEGNCMKDYGPYFTDSYKTFWGAAVNFDGPHSDPVRRFFIEDALFWVGECHLDGLRIDAVHAMPDFSARPFLSELSEAVHDAAKKQGRAVHLIAESGLNDTRVIRPEESGGYGLDAQWNDDFHHALHALLTGEKGGYYSDFGGLDHMRRAFQSGFVYQGEYSLYRGRRHGNRSGTIPAERFVVFSQNHDQVGNRANGERLCHILSFEKLKLAAALVLLSPYVPLLFMGEEYGETAPFLYFISHSDDGLINSVREGRKREFSAFDWEVEPPDPQAVSSFKASKLDHRLCKEGRHRLMVEYYKELTLIRQTVDALFGPSRHRMDVRSIPEKDVLFLTRWGEVDEAALFFHFSDFRAGLPVNLTAGEWRRRFDSGDTAWQGEGGGPDILSFNGSPIELSLSPWSALLLIRRKSDTEIRRDPPAYEA
jgi:maltooligosyltrehalose trehalohydrolase